jgi:hypothetical protein
VELALLLAVVLTLTVAVALLAGLAAVENARSYIDDDLSFVGVVDCAIGDVVVDAFCERDIVDVV